MISSGRFNESQLQQALSLKLLSGQYAALNSLPKFSPQWFKFAKPVARVDKNIAWQLTGYYQQRNSERNYKFWFAQALALGSKEALLEKSKQYAQQGNYQRFKQTAMRVTSIESLILQAKYSVFFEQSADFKHIIKTLEKSFSEVEKVNSLLLQLKTFNIYSVLLGDYKRISPPEITYINTHSNSENCPYDIQFFASDLDQLNDLFNRLEKVSNKPFFNKQMCFLIPQYVPKSKLNCLHNSASRINCDMGFLGEWNIDERVRYVGIVGNKGVANVNHGVVFIDDLDSDLVIEHELLHLLGFVDEYPLSKYHSACDDNDSIAIANNVTAFKKTLFTSEQQARRLVLPILPWYFAIKPSTPITHKTEKGFELGTPNTHSNEIGLFLANTCKNHKIKSFKSVKQVTQLEYYEELLPNVYQQILNVQSQKFMMPSYEYNVGLWLLEQGEIEKSKEWFERSALKESDLERQRNVALGNY